MSGGELTRRHALSVKFVKPIPTAAIRPLSRQATPALADNIEPKLAGGEQRVRRTGTRSRN